MCNFVLVFKMSIYIIFYITLFLIRLNEVSSVCNGGFSIPNKFFIAVYVTVDLIGFNDI